MLRDTHTNEYARDFHSCLQCALDERRAEEMCSVVGIVCYSLNVTNASDVCAPKQDRMICVCICSYGLVNGFFSLCCVEHLKQVWMPTFTTKQKGAHCQTFWLFVHNASISRLVSAQLFVCSIRLSKLNDNTEKSSKKKKRKYRKLFKNYSSQNSYNNIFFNVKNFFFF